MEGLIEGRIVHVRRANATHCIPAVVVRVWPSDDGKANLRLFYDGSNDSAAGSLVPQNDWATSVPYSEQPGVGVDTWHWPERA